MKSSNNKIQTETNANSRMNNSTDHKSDTNSTKVYNQGIGPKGKHQVFNKGSQLVNGVQNGNAFNSEKINLGQNGASCSSEACATSSSFSPSPPSPSLSDVSNGDCLSEKFMTKGRTLSSEENDAISNDKKRKTGNLMENESSSGNEGDEGLSGDDCCIYTYKGDQFADLPNSFFTVNMPLNERDQLLRENHGEMHLRRRRSRSEENEQSDPGSSPEMDYLEMDFDPGPSLDQDSEEDMEEFEKKSNNSEVPELPCEQLLISSHNAGDVKNMSINTGLNEDSQEPQPGPSNENMYWCSQERCNEPSNYKSDNINRTKQFGSSHCVVLCPVDENSQILDSSNQGADDEKTQDDVNSCSSHLFAGKRLDNKILLTEKNDLCSSPVNDSETDLKTPFNGIMLWTEEEATSKQVTLLSSEVSCGATAVINVMLVLKLRFSIEKVKEGISCRLRSESMSIPQYLVSRSFAGIAHENLIRGIHHASQGKLYARFFQMYPKRDVVLSRWLSYWMKKGAVPIATMNVQRDESGEDPTLDTRHHQMIFGVNSKGIHLTNPLECLEDDELWRRLNSPSTLKIKRKEITSRWSLETNLRPLMFQSDNRWKKMNVLGQVVNIIRESSDPKAQRRFLTQHISIPASSGITLVIERDSPGYEELVSSPDLPLSPKTSE